jgi:hypothetical protein
VYKELVEGDSINDFTNDFADFKIKIEKRRKNVFHLYEERSMIDKFQPDDSVGIEKIKLEPKDSIVQYFHLDHLYKFEVGDYRIKCSYFNHSNIITENAESKWVYFKVIKTIYVKHD